MHSEREEDRVRSQHIVTSCERIRHYVAGRTSAEFLADQMARDAVERNLEIISEASRHLSQSLKERLRHILWRDWAGLGNVYRHQYDDLVADRLWDAITEDIPILLRTLRPEAGTAV